MSDIGIPISGDIVERLMRRAHTLNGRPVADGDGNTYISGEYTRKDAALDQEAYAELSRLRAEVERLREGRALQDEEWESADDLRSKLKGLAAENARLREALDIDKAVDAAIFEWGLIKDTEYHYGDAVYFKANWRSLPGYRDAVDVQIGRRARKALEGGE